MIAVQRGLFLVGLIAGGALVVGIGAREPRPVVEPALGIRPAETIPSGKIFCADVERTAHTAAFRSPGDTRGEAFLVIALQEPARCRRSFEVHVGDENSGATRPLLWHAVDHPVETVIPSSLPARDGAIECSARDAIPTRREQWFLPQGASGRAKSDAIEVITIVETDRVSVVLDQDVDCNVTHRQKCSELATRLTQLIPQVEAAFGALADREPAGKLTVVVTPRVRQIEGGGKPVEAFVLASDYRLDLMRPDSNERDAMYLHPDLCTDSADAILVHELVHVAQFCAYRRHYSRSPWPLADWVLEGTAHAAEVLMTRDRRNVLDRLRAFAERPERSPLVVVDAMREGRWRDARCRGAATSFFTWLGECYGLEAVGSIALTMPDAGDVWVQATGKCREELIRGWWSSLLLQRTIAPHSCLIDQPLTLEIDGGAAAFVALPREHETAVTISGPRDRNWSACVIHIRREANILAAQ